jgi:hypothetical protein
VNLCVSGACHLDYSKGSRVLMVVNEPDGFPV